MTCSAYWTLLQFKGIVRFFNAVVSYEVLIQSQCITFSTGDISPFGEADMSTGVGSKAMNCCRWRQVSQPLQEFANN